MNTVDFGLQVRLVRGMYDSGEYEIAHIHLDHLAWDVLEMAAAGEDAQAHAQQLVELDHYMTRRWYG